jgi:alkanesulfonate monooxygenase SsuD/methylene tetrahydromethanopterin reductase-like flavin-dependent oxidoreductase (luciferase family)
MTGRPRVSVIIPRALRSSAAELNGFARHVEDCGLDGVAVGDHLAAAVPAAESTLTLAVAAAATRRITVGFGVMVLALRHPAWAAKQVATLQLLSGNRVILGVGIGGAVHGTAAWDAVGVPYAGRAARTDASLAILRGLIAGEPTSFPSGAELTLAPGAQPPPVWIGGTGPASRRRAVAHGDAWYPSMITPGEVAAGAAHLADLSAERDRAQAPTVAVGGSVLLGAAPPCDLLDAHVSALTSGYRVPPDVAPSIPLTGPPAAVAEGLRSYSAAGAQHVVLGLIDNDDWHRQCDLLAEALSLA